MVTQPALLASNLHQPLLTIHPQIQAPKTLPPLAKQNLILTYLQSSRTVHSIKDLEKSLPAVASINGMQVKDYLQALHDEGKIRVEKIGSGNWYWSFLSEEKNTRDVTMSRLNEEQAKIDTAVEELEEKIKVASEMRGENEGRGELVTQQLNLTEEVGVLRKELEGYKDNDPGEVDRKRKEIAGFRAKAERWTDNIEILEGRLLEMMGGDREGVDGVKREVYGDEYVKGEGLKEL
ncbi:hypothetical protein OEA41_000341 [Lepraria neglecta]|uniref:Meiotic nuclear division protein 1 n=1 Tax=Lepraria neglecta TaxID=209136 RepID=A0AAD9ZI96_9LECA|nr:hypothetical protein OEA41_000341 [Lepraria neglecta]